MTINQMKTDILIGTDLTVNTVDDQIPENDVMITKATVNTVDGQIPEKDVLITKVTVNTVDGQIRENGIATGIVVNSHCYISFFTFK